MANRRNIWPIIVVYRLFIITHPQFQLIILSYKPQQKNKNNAITIHKNKKKENKHTFLFLMHNPMHQFFVSTNYLRALSYVVFKKRFFDDKKFTIISYLAKSHVIQMLVQTLLHMDSDLKTVIVEHFGMYLMVHQNWKYHMFADWHSIVT